MPNFSVFVAFNPFGRPMQVWGTPAHHFPEVIATDYPDPDTCSVSLIISTPSFTEAFRSWKANASALRTTCRALGVSAHTINPELED